LVNGGAKRTTRLDTQRLPRRMDGIDPSKFVIGRLEEALLIVAPGVRMRPPLRMQRAVFGAIIGDWKGARTR
jgi:hypothetical protein